MRTLFSFLVLLMISALPAQAQLNPDYQISDDLEENICNTAAKGMVWENKLVFQRVIEDQMKESGAKTHNEWWERYYPEIICKFGKKSNIPGFPSTYEEMGILIYMAKLREFHSLSGMDTLDYYFSHEMDLNINLRDPVNGHTLVTWLTLQEDEADNEYDKGYFRELREYIQRKYNAKDDNGN